MLCKQLALNGQRTVCSINLLLRTNSVGKNQKKPKHIVITINYGILSFSQLLSNHLAIIKHQSPIDYIIIMLEA